MVKVRIAAALSMSFVTACTTTDSGPVSTNGLAGSTWRLVALRSNDGAISVVHPDDPSKYEMTLGADGTATMRLDCNRARGGWHSAAVNRITFTPLAMTRAMCLGGSLDTRVARELGDVRSYILERDRLTLTMMANGGSQVWTRAGD